MSQNQFLSEQLQKGLTVSWRPKGNSMTPIIKSGQRVTVEPVTDPFSIKAGDVVFAKVRGSYYLHLVKRATFTTGEPCKFLIGNNHGGINGCCQ